MLDRFEVKNRIENTLDKLGVKNRVCRGLLVESYRRTKNFHNGDASYKMLLLAVYGQAQKAIDKGYIKPYSNEVKRAFNWYSLTDKGIEIVNAIDNAFDGKWDKEMNEFLFSF